MESRRMVDVLASRWHVVLLTVIAAVAVAWLVFQQVPPRYTAVVLLRLHPVAVADVDVTYRLDFADRFMNSFATLAESDWMQSELDGLSRSEKEVAIQAEIPANTDLMRISVTHIEPLTAAQLANEAGQLVAELSLQPTTLSVASTGSSFRFTPSPAGAPLAFAVFEPASVPVEPSSLSLPMTLLLAGLLGVVGGTGLAFLVDRLVIG